MKIDDVGMKMLGRQIKEMIGSHGFALLIFDFNSPGISNYISNGRRADMILALKETVKRLEAKEDFDTPTFN